MAILCYSQCRWQQRFGTIFRISAAGNFKVLKSLNATTDGKTPKGNLLLAAMAVFMA
jgi:hypothetical protein